MIEFNLLLRIEELENALKSVRKEAAYNLANPGNEDDSLSYVVDVATSVLHDNYVYKETDEDE